MKFLRKLFSDKKIEKKYVQAGTQFGYAVSYIYMGECVGFESMLNKWGDYEQEYAERGYRTISLDKFVELGGYGKNIDKLIGKKRRKNEKPIFHAEIYKEKYLGKVTPVISLEKMMQDKKPQFGNYILPSTTKIKH